MWRDSMGLGQILIEADDPAYLEAQVDPEAETLDIAALDANTLLAAHRRRQDSFDTAVMDPAGRLLKFFPGGYTIKSGTPGSGKTSMWRQDVCHWLRRNRKVFVCSLEEHAEETFMELAMTALGTPMPTADAMQFAIDFWQGKLFILSMKTQRVVSLQRILAIARVLAKRCDGGLNHIVIDPYARLDIGTSDWEAQRCSANEVVVAAGVTNSHVHLICHPRKPLNRDTEPDLYEVGGSADLTRLAWNVVFTMRSADDTKSLDEYCDARLKVCKQRYGSGYLGYIDGHWVRGLRQFHPTIESASSPTRYLPSGAYGDLAITEGEPWA